MKALIFSLVIGVVLIVAFGTLGCQKDSGTIDDLKVSVDKL